MIFGKYINHYYKKYALPLFLGILSLIAVDWFQLKVPELYQMVVNGLNDGAVMVDGIMLTFDMAFLLERICKPLLVIVLVMLIGRFLWRVCFFSSAIRVETDLRGRMFDHCKDLSQGFYSENKVGNLMSLFTNDLETIQESFGDGILMLCDAVLMGVLAFAKMLRLNGLMTLFSMIPMAFLLVISAVLGHYMEKKWDVRQEAFSHLSDFSQEHFSGIAVVKAFVKETKEVLAFGKLNKENEDTNIAFTKYAMLLRIMVPLFVESVICVILGVGGAQVHKGALNAGQLVEYIGYFNAIIWPVMAISELIEMRSRGQASMKRIAALLEQEPEVKDREDVKDVDVLTGDIELRNLSFRYPGGEYDVLRNVSFHISAGENVGIIGRTGAGKTTLVDLLLRTYNVPDGTVFLDGRDINSIPIHTVRDNAAYVPQDNFLFSDTIVNNITFAIDGADKQDAIGVARLADVHEDIAAFTKGYDTVLGERGVTVSGGQKQRISIARALLKSAPILIMDDSVSAVDVDTEKHILESLRGLRSGKTTILIAHRISTVEGMDKILFLEDGQLIACGTHAELLENCRSYRDMVRLQQLDKEQTEVNGNA